MRECGDCTLCCKLERINEFNKPSQTWCEHCKGGCSIFDKPERPTVCHTFRCRWLDDNTMSDMWRPDLINAYAVTMGPITKVVSDPDHDFPIGASRMVEHMRQFNHVVVMCGNQLNFHCGLTRERPEKLVIDWTL